MGRWFTYWLNATLTAQGLAFAYACAMQDEAARLLKEERP